MAGLEISGGEQEAVRAAMWATVPRLLAEQHYVVLGTADEEGRPWVTPVFFAAEGEHRILWVSAAGSRHSRNIGVRAEVALTVFDSHAPIGGAEALYLEATASPVAGHADLAVLNARLPERQHLGPEDLEPAGTLLVYQALVSRHFVLIRGGDGRFDNITDARLEVRGPSPDGAG
ncbi:pyridoxamine 5'-phosphate oxidase family protein [Actinoplanes friuliensis]|uniref:Pyridoxamine 5'-phosphate oxidase-related FMN-binding protein n=1 Tax=Actinoplanes friuliensis DSM 7358 TaxID=1246995 RepID=U5W116_9ACTN|nr:pyridoxamine 5'-phosphate oxidase family protein [Actinoplanes friuliensis]AGZ42707.1 pyridoxamine 5'-phosphate oxidase-related FMN- binding protein [Actinoplanes friuliensis DSM 7358]